MVVVPGQHELAIALEWGGTSHPVWFKRDPRVALSLSDPVALKGERARATIQGTARVIEDDPHATRTRAVAEVRLGMGRSLHR